MFGKLGIALLAATLVAGCMGKSVTLAGRPMIYPQGPGDPPDKVEEVTAGSGVLGKKPTAAPQQTTAAASPQGNVLGSVPRPAWAVQGDTVASAAPPMAPMASMPASGPAAGVMGLVAPATRYGDMLFVSGQVAIDPRTGALSSDRTIEGQTRQVMENIRATLDANRLTMANVLSATVIVSNMDNLAAADRVYGSFFKSALPSRSVLEASRLPNGALIEISVVAGR